MASHPRLLPRSAPSAERLDAGGVLALLDRLAERSAECHSIMVVRHGSVIAEGWWAPYSPDRPHLLYSLTKSFISVAVGLAVSDGRLRLDDRVTDVLDDHVPAGLAPQARQLSVRHLLAMTTGHRADTLAAAWALEPADLVKGFLRVPAPDPVGTRHAYNNPTSFVLARMVERVTGRSVPDLLDDRLFGPMGVEQAEWDRVASGATFGFHGLHLTTEAVAAFGELLLRGGRWRGRQLVARMAGPGHQAPRRDAAVRGRRAPGRLAARLRVPLLDVPAGGTRRRARHRRSRRSREQRARRPRRDCYWFPPEPLAIA